VPRVRCWHFADIDFDAEHVCFRGKADIPDPLFANPNLALSVKLNVDLPCFVCG
jgi:hypothetical protein